ncbi:Solute carrier family 2, facilitated glucose transporter member 3 [Smittium culicis]|uniref:Solute carrier family 2, facilitated glucose transporter member 3 n=1 Tax=Smittium culicis TaxID=133412 RepID=A0A1R1YLQ8_9FUNG|nr:Solute carrier family 2, facilitated glucose transporter member 3 [Smittium culicis]OMJ27867.1 Solute carrier family 2, facilitated glucose transporter member 3 [Smittium culicis]
MSIHAPQVISSSPLLPTREIGEENPSSLNQSFDIQGIDPSNQNTALTRFCIMCGVIASISAFITGYKMSELNNSKDSIMYCNPNNNTDLSTGLPQCLPMTDNYFAFITSVLAIGALIGSLSSSHFADTYGRKYTIIFNSCTFFIGSIFEAFAITPFMLLFGRFVSGIAGGIGLVVVPMYLTEISPVDSRGFLNLFNQLGLVLGVFVAQSMGYYFNTGDGWRYVLGLGIFLSICSGIFMFYTVESPKYLHSKSLKKQSVFSLRKLRGTQDVDDEFSSWSPTNNENQDEHFSYERSTIDSQPAGLEHETSSNELKITLFSIFSIRKYRHPILLVVFLQLSQQLSGINTVIFYSNSIFNKNFSQSTSSLLTILVGLVNVIFTVLAVFVVDAVSRKKLLFTSIASMFFSLGLLTFSLVMKLKYLSAISIFLAIMSFAPGLGPLPFLLATEIFDTKAMAVGNSVSITSNWFFVFIVGSSFFALENALGNYVFVFFMSFLAVTSVFFYYYLPETKDKSFEQISHEFTL